MSKGLWVKGNGYRLYDYIVRFNILARPYRLSCFNRAVVSVHRVHCSQYRMQYTLESFHNVEKKISDVFDTILSTAKCKGLDDITDRAFVNSQKIC